MDLSKLNPPQREAVVTLQGPLLVLAGAGSGKTRVITHRIVHLLNERPNHIMARNILAVTFTNKAATEMKERLIHMAGPRAQGVLVCTFHAFGAEVLREDIHRLGWPKKFAIADMGDQLSIIRRAMRDKRIDDRAFDARKVLTLISKAKNSGEAPQPKPEGMGDDYDLITSMVFADYQLALKAQGSVDFDDLLVLPARLLREHPDLHRKYTARFQYLLVDEFQDTNHAQLDLLKLLAGEARNVCAVGDDDQCIYSWRGAEVRNILDFERHFPGGKEVRLEQNYRSSQRVLDAANAVIAKNPERKDKRMWTDRKGGPLVKVVACPNDEEEARFIAHEIQKHISLGVPADDIAVLYRTNGQAHPVEEMLREKSIAYEVVGGSEFFDRSEVKDVIAYFKVLANKLDEISLMRIVNVPSRGIGDVTMERLHAHSRAEGVTLWTVMRRADTYDDLPSGAGGKVLEFVEMVERYRDAFTQTPRLSEATHKLLEEIGFREATRAKAVSGTAADKKLKGVDGVLASLEKFEKREGPKASLLTYLNRLSLDTRQEEEDIPGQNKRVTLMSLHASKGLEYRLVFFIGMEEDLMPHGGMQGEAQNLEEERRLCYVGITRAKELLYLTRSTVRVKRGKEVPRTPSRFLEDLPPDAFENVDMDAPRQGPPDEKEKNFFANLKERFKKPAAGGAGPGTPGRAP
ncbi:UvrD-helicase domain-containing protein [Corallococcus exiguus]|uniref:ATP-dependent helicase n=1 Tax=Corallococcus exiguus TaxID=83462 RepID=UPI001A904435|nr:UvrD-helicase domain-containing protein [Corallococcus exiguus]MBN8468727.1 UvrD-helicase domain-containing protein [Corallococcus exiguus]